MSEGETFELQLFIDGARKRTDNLTKDQARDALTTAEHMADYLRASYLKTEADAEQSTCIVCRSPILLNQSQIGYGDFENGIAYHKQCDGVFNDIERAVTERLAAKIAQTEADALDDLCERCGKYLKHSTIDALWCAQCYDEKAANCGGSEETSDAIDFQAIREAARSHSRLKGVPDAITAALEEYTSQLGLLSPTETPRGREYLDRRTPEQQDTPPTLSDHINHDARRAVCDCNYGPEHEAGCASLAPAPPEAPTPPMPNEVEAAPTDSVTEGSKPINEKLSRMSVCVLPGCYKSSPSGTLYCEAHQDTR